MEAIIYRRQAGALSLSLALRACAWCATRLVLSSLAHPQITYNGGGGGTGIVIAIQSSAVISLRREEDRATEGERESRSPPLLSVLPE